MNFSREPHLPTLRPLALRLLAERSLGRGDMVVTEDELRFKMSPHEVDVVLADLERDRLVVRTHATMPWHGGRTTRVAGACLTALGRTLALGAAPAEAPASPAPRGRRGDARRVLRVGPNVKRPGSASRERFELWRSAETVADYLAAGGLRADVLHDTRHGLVTLEQEN